MKTSGGETFLHPGFPKIGAIEKFRNNVQKRLDEARAEFISESKKIDTGEYPLTHSKQNAIRIKKKQDTTLGMQAYFDKSAVKSASKDITNEVIELGKRIMDDQLSFATFDTIQSVGRRNFKSKISPSKSASGDMYEVIADSLRFESRTEQDNQFASYVAGSFDGHERLPTGVKGSRMHDDISLIEITEQGTSPFFAHLVKSVFANPAKRNMK